MKLPKHPNTTESLNICQVESNIVHVLLTNDDGVDSEALMPTIASIRMAFPDASLQVVVPKVQQSWKGKANTRRCDDIPLSIISIGNETIHVLDGLPADCANFGIYNLQMPDLLISGANLGHNVGLPFTFSSGTVGAAMEGLFAGIPAIAISCPYPPYQHGKLEESVFHTTLTKLLPPLLGTFYTSPPKDVCMVSININYGNLDAKIHGTYLMPIHYQSLFVYEEGKVRPRDYREFSYNCDPLPGSDYYLIKQGEHTITGFDSRFHQVDAAIISNWLTAHQLTG